MKMTLNFTIVSTINIIKTVIILRTVTTSKIRIYPCASITTSVVLVFMEAALYLNLGTQKLKKWP